MKTRSSLRVRLFGCLAASVLCLAIPLRLGVVIGNSMSPSLHNGSLYLLSPDKDPGKIQPGDVVVFRRDGLNYIKRVVAVGGEQVYVTTIPGSGRDELVMDWQLNRMRRAYSHPGRSSIKMIARKVPPGYCYVVGDHIAASVDSRDLGPISTEQILGKLIAAPEPVPQLDHLAVVSSTQLAAQKS